MWPREYTSEVGYSGHIGRWVVFCGGVFSGVGCFLLCFSVWESEHI